MDFNEIWHRFILNVDILACRFSYKSVHPLNWIRTETYGTPLVHTFPTHLSTETLGYHAKLYTTKQMVNVSKNGRPAPRSHFFRSELKVGNLQSYYYRTTMRGGGDKILLKVPT